MVISLKELGGTAIEPVGTLQCKQFHDAPYHNSRDCDKPEVAGFVFHGILGVNIPLKLTGVCDGNVSGKKIRHRAFLFCEGGVLAAMLLCCDAPRTP
jgi:hypothetical protein